MPSAVPCRILLVEDDPDIQALAKLALESIGKFTVVLCNSGGEALQQAPSFQPDLIILDVVMPGQDGPSTLEALRSLPDYVVPPVIFLTAKGEGSEADYLRQMGAIGVIGKPFDPFGLSAHIAQLWAKSYG